MNTIDTSFTASFSSQSETAGDYVMSTAQSPSSPTYTDSPFAQTNWNGKFGLFEGTAVT